MNKDEMIMNDLHHKLEYLQKSYNVLGIFLRGSQNYGMDIYSDEYVSDIDAVAFIMPSLQELIKGEEMLSKTIVMKDNSHIEVKDIRLLITLLYKANPSYIEILFTKYKILCNEQMQWLIDNNEKLAHLNECRLAKAIYGTIVTKSKSMFRKTKTNEKVFKKFGYNPKDLHHAMRMHECNEIYSLFYQNDEFRHLAYNYCCSNFCISIKERIFDVLLNMVKCSTKSDETRSFPIFDIEGRTLITYGLNLTK